jgi:hypothetical protein
MRTRDHNRQYEHQLKQVQKELEQRDRAREALKRIMEKEND